MPRYFFHLRNDLSVNDEEGIDLPSIEAARARATEFAVDMAAASVTEHHRIILNHRIEIANRDGRLLDVVKFGDAVTILEEA